MRLTATTLPLLLAAWVSLGFPAPSAAADPAPQTYRVGVAKTDITPGYPVPLNGFANRKGTESAGVTQRIWAKALAIDDGEPAVLIAVDTLGIPAAMTQEVAAAVAPAAATLAQALKDNKDPRAFYSMSEAAARMAPQERAPNDTLG
jgi:hypothetical protein